MRTDKKEIDEMLKPVLNNENLKVEIVESILYAKIQKDGDFYRFMFENYYQAELLIHGSCKYIRVVDGKTVEIDNVSSAFITAADNLISEKKIDILSNGRFVSGEETYFSQYIESDKSVGFRFQVSCP